MSKKHLGLIIQILIYVLAIAVNVLIVVSSCLNGFKSTNQSSWVVNLLSSILNFFNKNAVTEANKDQFAHVVRKLIGHYGLFLLSGCFTSLSIYFLFSKKKWFNITYFSLMSLLFGAFLAILTECIQLNVPGRSGQFSDVLIDFSGYLTSFLIIFIVLYFCLKNRDTSKEE